MSDIREIVAEVLELSPEEISESGDFIEEYGADSMSAIEILAGLDRHFDIEIPQEHLAQMRNLREVYAVVAREASWEV
ncbi:acyl carrier protein [Nonomuraea longispora]|nr:acyl carrier protein [Nonomuraea longispora]